MNFKHINHDLIYLGIGKYIRASSGNSVFNFSILLKYVGTKFKLYLLSLPQNLQENIIIFMNHNISFSLYNTNIIICTCIT